MSKLTKSRIDSLSPKASEDEVCDSALPGFHVRIQPSGRKSFVVVFRLGKGRSAPQRRHTIGRTDQLSADQARRRAIEILAKVSLGEDPFKPAVTAITAMTMDRVFDRFLAEHVNTKLKPRTRAEYARMIDTHLRPRLGGLSVEDLTSSHARQLHHDNRVTPRLANHLIAVLSKTISEAERWALRGSLPNPCRGLQRYPERKRGRLFSPAEIDLIENGLETHCHPTIATAIRFAMFTGCRSEEVCSLRWEDVDYDRRELRLADTKTGPLAKPLSGAIDEMLRQWGRGSTSQWVFPPLRGGDHHLHPRVLRSAWTKLLRRLGVAHAGIHALRHWFASAVYSDPNISLPTGMKILGHRNCQTALGYAHMSTTDLVEVTDQAILRIRQRST